MRRDPISVNRSPLNKSPSKQLVSFTKAQRFPSTLRPNCERMYQPRSTFVQQQRSMGYGTKTKFGVGNNQPEPGTYTLRSSFEDNQQKLRGSKFGLANRDYILVDQDKAHRFPSPSQYCVTNSLKYPSLSYSLGPRTKKGRTEFINEAGPGQYQFLGALSPTGTYYNSKFLNSGCSRFPRSSRFRGDETCTPGPGKYTLRGISSDGSYFNSKIPNSQARSFSKIQRKFLKSRADSPGPGHYQRFSDFSQHQATGKFQNSHRY